MIIELVPTAAAAEESPFLGVRDLDSLGIDINDTRTAESEFSDAVLGGSVAAAESPNPDSSPGLASDDGGDLKHADADAGAGAGGERNTPENLTSELESIHEADSGSGTEEHVDQEEEEEEEEEEEAHNLTAALGISMEEIVSRLEWLQRVDPDEFNALVRDITNMFDLLGFALNPSQVRELNADSSASASRRVRSLILCVNRLICIISATRIRQGSLRRGSHLAASRLAVESLPSVLVTAEDFGADGMLCVVCGDEISIGDWATPLPCSHYYHGDCIVPWLRIRNTCPLCRRELPAEENPE
ncbi:E3 ubiquitin-protein ligase CIP8-like [Ananas comosus]|uniref:E3 ubiquitin-protein ligase CIP8-like n=1 Tax=Ananas comosus TaxID=4615 RepID=A0A199UYM0_ANACO|nr:E3 ubiquitin-protein ligase CIP8-like [Ananas comosus]XP_020103733.1 E3 ubiquitin-protein ligase CIP8-like [Ananas comosus]OAY69716.1 E3 ubiquitin-protein ligase RING1 [Ananas comosus]